MKLKFGIFFGGPSREREQSFATAQLVAQKLDRQLFDPVLIFIDIHNHMILLEEKWIFEHKLSRFFKDEKIVEEDYEIYQESTLLYPEPKREAFQVKLGKTLSTDALPQIINLAFVDLRLGKSGEQRILDLLISHRIPFVGANYEARQFLDSKTLFRQKLANLEIELPAYTQIDIAQLSAEQSYTDLFKHLKKELGLPFRIAPDRQNGNFADALILNEEEEEQFKENINRAFFKEIIPVDNWRHKSAFEQKDHVQFLVDLKDGLGFPIKCKSPIGETLVRHPKALLERMEEQAKRIVEPNASFELHSQLELVPIVAESYLSGHSFQCLVIEDENGAAYALKPQVNFIKEKNAPAWNLTQLELDYIRKYCQSLFQKLKLGPSVIVEGLYRDVGEIYCYGIKMNLPSRTDARLLSHLSQIDWNSHQFLNYYILRSLHLRVQEYPEQITFPAILEHLRTMMATSKESTAEIPKLALLVGGEREDLKTSLQAADSCWENLNSTGSYDITLYWLASLSPPFELRSISPAVVQAIAQQEEEIDLQNALELTPLEIEIKRKSGHILSAFNLTQEEEGERLIPLEKLKADFVFVLAGTPFKDGRIHQTLEKNNIPFNASAAQTLALSFNQYQSLQALSRNGLQTVKQVLIKRQVFNEDPLALIERTERQLPYPLLARPIGGESGFYRKIINDREEFSAYAKLLFRPMTSLALDARKILKIKEQAFFPVKEQFLVEEYANFAKGGFIALETGVLSTGGTEQGLQYRILPSEGYPINRSLVPDFRQKEGEKMEELYKREIDAAVEKAARVLNIQSYALFGSYFRIFEDQSIALYFRNIDALPFLGADQALLRQAQMAGYNATDILEHIIASGSSQEKPTQTKIVRPIMANDFDLNEDAQAESQNNTPIADNEEKGQALSQPSGSFFKRMFQGLKSFVLSGIFLKNALALIFLSLLLLFGMIGLLNLYTHHGKYYVVENYVDLDFNDARKKARQNTFRAVIVDSVYKIGEKPNLVTDQDPKPGSKVKKRRTIYLWVTSSKAPLVLLPQLAGKDDFESYRRELDRDGVTLKIKEQKYDRMLEENTLMEFYYDDQLVTIDDVAAGFKVRKGSTLEAVVSSRSKEAVQIPNLVCETFEAAKFQIDNYRLNLGEVIGTMNNRYYVTRQDPPYEEEKEIKTGTTISIWLSPEKPVACDHEVKPIDENEEF